MAAEAEILLADDNDVGRYVIATMLRRAGFEVRETVDGVQAIEEARRAPPDIAVLDVKMPGFDGFEACRQLKADPATRHVPVLLLSATFLNPDDQVEGLEVGADGYLTQPVEAPVLAATVRALLRTRRAEREVREVARQWRITFDAISDAVAVVDPEGILGRVNVAFADLVGRPAADLVGRALADVAPRVAAAVAVPERDQELTVEDRTFGLRIDDVPGETPDAAHRVVTLRDVTLARRAAIERAEAFERERTISLTLQQSLLPERFPRQERVALDAWFVAAERELIVGGDWYDVIETEDAVWLVIGDVAGHGVAAAAQAGQLRHSLRVYAHEGYALPAAMARLNELVMSTRLTGMATVCVAAIDRVADELRVVRAGHPPPLLVPAGQPPRLVEERRGMLLGIAGGVHDELRLPFGPGDRIVLYTDGLIERPGEGLDDGLARMVDAASGLEDLTALRDGLVARLIDLAHIRDDIAMLLAERL
jgi:serine phosphatase RsbU (regulator of sigma subunit)/FixJ family two-component response regulator